jgi:hypothetical protein
VIRRICLVGVALGAVTLAFGVAVATASKSKTTKAKSTTVYCDTSVSIAVPATDTDVTPAATSGNEYGSVICHQLGHGVQADSFTVPNSGDTVARFTFYMPTGTLSGTYDLTPQTGSLGSGFASVSYLGTLKVTHGTGALAGVTGTGTMTCSSPDSIHTSCTDKLKLTSKSGVL